MMHLTVHGPRRVWNPWRELNRLQAEVDQAFGRLPRFFEEVDYPPVNIVRFPDRVVIEAVAPGLDRSTLDVTTVGNTLTIRGERRAEEGVKANAYHRRERELGHFVRTIELDERVSTGNVSATYRDGILRIELGYAPEAKPRKITIAG